MTYRLTHWHDDEPPEALMVSLEQLAEVRTGRLDRLDAPPTPTSLERADVLAIVRALDHGYVVHLDGVRSMASLVWRRRCEVEGWPFVGVWTHGRLARVQVVPHPSVAGLSTTARARIDAALRRHGAQGRVVWRGVQLTRPIPLRDALALAGALWAIATEDAAVDRMHEPPTRRNRHWPEDG